MNYTANQFSSVFRHAKILAQTVVTDALYLLWLLTEKATLGLHFKCEAALGCCGPLSVVYCYARIHAIHVSCKSFVHVMAI